MFRIKKFGLENFFAKENEWSKKCARILAGAKSEENWA
jgi:hypothetical protein